MLFALLIASNAFSEIVWKPSLDYKDMAILRLAEKGDALAQFKVGEILFRKMQDPRRYALDHKLDPSEIIYWLEKAANQGNLDAHYTLALGYGSLDFYGLPVPEENRIMLSHSYMKKAAEGGHILGMEGYARQLERRNDVEAAKWYLRYESVQGNGSGYYAVGNMYYYGIGFAKDDSEALKWFKKAAEKNHGLCKLGSMYIIGEAVNRNYVKALDLSLRSKVNAPRRNRRNHCNKNITQLAERGFEDALIYLVNNLSEDEAYKWANILAKKGHAESQNILGNIYRNGKKVLRDYKLAKKWYEKSAAQGNVNAQESLGNMYKNGEGVSTNNIKAYIWLAMAKHHGAYVNLNALERELSVSELNKAQKLAKKCLSSNYKDCDPWFAW